MKNTVLIADPNKTFAMYVGILLKRMGFETLTARDGYEAMSLVETCRPDIVLADERLPQYDALTALVDFGTDPDGYRPSCVFMTSAAERNTDGNRQVIGACTSLVKPVTTDSLHHAVQECLYRPTGHIRRHVRASVCIRLTLYHESGERELFTDTLGEGGTFIKTDEPLPVGDVANVFLPCGDEECLFLTGRVIYTRQSGSPATGSASPGFAIEFMEISDGDRAALSDFVERMLVEDLDIDGLRDGISAGAHTENSVYAALRSYASGLEGPMAAGA